MFNVQFSPFLAALFKESIACWELPATLKQDPITIIPEPMRINFTGTTGDQLPF